VLRDYQSAATDAAISWCKYKDTPCIIDIATGGGKSHIITALAEHYYKLGERVCILAHRKELLEQSGAKMTVPFGYYSASVGEKNVTERVIIAGIQSIYNKSLEKFDVIIIDECFVGDTKIKTIHGDKNIDCIKQGDLVLSASGYNKVLSTFCKNESNFYEIKLSNGKFTRCTADHPFFTQEGWKKAADLVVGTNLYSEEKLQELWSGFLSASKNEAFLLGKEEVLLSILLEEIGKSNVYHNPSKENDGFIKKNRTQAENSWGKWERINNTSDSYIKNLTEWLDGGICHKNKKTAWLWLSNLLQSGFSKSTKNDNNRNRWSKSLWESQKIRQKERRFSSYVRVEDIQIIKSASPESVYNLRVDGHPSYFANGVLVHNCHRVPNNDELGQYWQFINANKPCKVIGLSATPHRLQGGLLGWGEIIYEAKYPLLLKLGHLAPITNKVRNTPDLSAVKLVAGEYNEGLLSHVMEDPRLIEAAVKNIMAYGADRRSVLIFCVGVKHAELLAHHIPGCSVATLTGDTPKSQREDILLAFKERRLKYLINCEILLEGFDAPNVDMIACLRPTKSKALWEQMLGRGVRKHPSKENCFLLDMAGNLMEHGGLGTPYRDKVKREREKPPGRICPECETYCPISAKQCDDCGYEFPKEDPHKANHNLNADTKSGAVYEGHIEIYEVRGVSYCEHISKKNTHSLRVDYFCNTKYGKISEWYSPHHENDWARGKVVKLFSERGEPLLFDPKEYSMEELLFKCESLRSPIRITVDHKEKFPRVISYEFSKESGSSDTASVDTLLEGDSIPF